jgi:hypothetical protein
LVILGDTSPTREKLVLGDRTEALVYILAHELRHMHQQHGYAVLSSFPWAG